MKKAFLSVISMILISGAGFLASCGGGGDPKVDSFKVLQSGTWKMKAVTIDGDNANSDFTGLTVSFSASGFTSTNGAPVWPSSGTWSKNTSDAFTRNDGLTVTIDNASNSALTLSLNWTKTTLGGGRVGSIAGEYVFTFSK